MGGEKITDAESQKVIPNLGVLPLNTMSSPQLTIDYPNKQERSVLEDRLALRGVMKFLLQRKNTDIIQPPSQYPSFFPQKPRAPLLLTSAIPRSS